MKKIVLALLISIFSAGLVLADDCGNNKDHGKGNPSCGDSSTPGTGTTTVTNDNINQNLNNLKSSSKSTSSADATGVGIGFGGSVKDSGNSSIKNSGNSSSTAVAVGEGGKGGSAKQGQVQGQLQGQTQSSASNSSATNGGQSNSQSTEYTNNEAHQVATAYAPMAYPSAPCRVSGSVGLQAPFGGLSAGGSKLDKQCDMRETARAFALLGDVTSARAILLQTDAAKKAKLPIHTIN